nr:pogo transposable element with znf domain [Quercus suber]
MASNEGSMLLAMQALKSGHLKTVNAAAQAYNVSKSTLLRRMKGTPSKAQYTPLNKRLSLVEEEAIVQRVLQLDSQGLCPSIAIVRQMADSICHARDAPPVGINWTSNFIKRTPALSVRVNRTYECQRKQCEDPQIIQDWFKLVRETICKHSILPEDIYNFDETGFQMGQISTSKVVTSTDRQGRPKQIRPTGAEWVTCIQGAGACGYILPPFLIFKGKEYNKAWFEGLPPDWMIATSPNGWTSDEIGHAWIHHFDRHTKAHQIGAKRLLILDNHSSHKTIAFINFCEAEGIVLLWMPPHSSHMLQPLDVGCFGPLKRAFSRQNEALIKNHIFHITRLDFISSFYIAFKQAITPANVQGGFKGAGIHPFNPEVVLSQLDPLPQSQVTELQQVNEAFHTRKKRKKAPFRSEQPVSVEYVQALAAEVVEQLNQPEVSKPARKPPTCTKCHTQGHTRRNCSSDHDHSHGKQDIPKPQRSLLPGDRSRHSFDILGSNTIISTATRYPAAIVARHAARNIEKSDVACSESSLCGDVLFITEDIWCIGSPSSNIASSDTITALPFLTKHTAPNSLDDRNYVFISRLMTPKTSLREKREKKILQVTQLMINIHLQHYQAIDSEGTNSLVDQEGLATYEETTVEFMMTVAKAATQCHVTVCD